MNRNKIVNNADASLTPEALASAGKFIMIFPRSDKLKCTTECAGQSAPQAEKFAQIKFADFLDEKEGEVPSAWGIQIGPFAAICTFQISKI